MSIFEVGMLICFGLGWPASILKAWRTKKVSGKSPVFLFIVGLGYICGIIHKLLFSLDLVLIFYIFNLSLVTIDLALYLYYSQQKTLN